MWDDTDFGNHKEISLILLWNYTQRLNSTLISNYVNTPYQNIFSCFIHEDGTIKYNRKT